MPKFAKCYIGTITFSGDLTFKQKTNRIENLYMHFQQMFSGRYFIIEYMIEYHKIHKGSEEDDLEAPHIHFIAWFEQSFPKKDYQQVLNYMQKNFGRSQFFVGTGAKSQWWHKSYMRKDIEKYPNNYKTVKWTQEERDFLMN